MPVLDLDGLTRYDGNIKNYIRRFANWQKSQKAGAVAVYPVPETVLEPVVDFLFSETGPASGTKGPDNPSTITGVTQAKVTRCGKNVIPFPYADSSKVSGGITWTVNSDGTVTASGTATANSFFTFYNANSGILKPGIQYTLSCCPSGGSASTYYVCFGSGSTYDDTGNGSTFTADTAIASKNLIARIASGTVLSTPITFKPQIEIGSVATSFEKYEGADYTVNLGGTFYGGSVDLSTGVMTVTWEAVKLTGNETWALDSGSTEASSVFQSNLGLPNMTMSSVQNASTRCCSHFPYSGSSSVPYRFMTWGNATRVYFAGPASAFPDANSFKAFLAGEYAAGHPVILVYVKAAPQTVQLSPAEILSLAQTDKYTPRLNTIYTDAQAVQVGYAKSPIRSEYELTQAIIATEGGE